jgi:branched-chain amino acid transport system permease protein
MTLFLDYTLNGIANGMIYASLALALVLIFRATRIINFAQGAAGMLTTFIAIGAVTQRLLIRPLIGKSELNPVIVTIGLLVVFEGLAGAIYGNASRGFPAAFSQRGLRFGSTTVAFSHFDVFILVAVLIMMTAMLVLFRFTSLGLRMRASAFAQEIARLLGVRVGLLLTLGWGLAGIAGSLAGLLVAPTSAFGPYYMNLILVYGFTAAVIGGLESPVGALVGGLISGLCISYVGGYLGSGLEPLGALALLMVALMARPEGIFARPPARRV